MTTTPGSKNIFHFQLFSIFCRSQKTTLFLLILLELYGAFQLFLALANLLWQLDSLFNERYNQS